MVTIERPRKKSLKFCSITTVEPRRKTFVKVSRSMLIFYKEVFQQRIPLALHRCVRPLGLPPMPRSHRRTKTSPSQIVTFSPTLGDPQLGKAQAKQSLQQCYGGIGSKAISLADYTPSQGECDFPSNSASILQPLYLCVLSMWDRLNLHLPLFTMTPTSIVCHFNLPHIQLAPSHFLPFLTIQITRSHTPTPHLGFHSRITYPCIQLFKCRCFLQILVVPSKTCVEELLLLFRLSCSLGGFYLIFTHDLPRIVTFIEQYLYINMEAL